MKRHHVAGLLSLFTCFGGHCYNGRWVKAAFFAVAVVSAWLIALTLSVVCRVLYDLDPHSVYAITISGVGWVTLCVALESLAVLVVWVASVRAAVADARMEPKESEDEPPMLHALSGLGLSAVSVLVAGSIIGLLFISFVQVNPPRVSLDNTSLPRLYRLLLEEMNEFLAGLQDRGFTLTPPRQRVGFCDWRDFGDTSGDGVIVPGSGTIRGRVRSDGRPVAGLVLRLFFEPDLKTDWLASDAAGQYSISVQPGQYRFSGCKIDKASADALLNGQVADESLRRQLYGKQLTVRDNSATSGPDVDFRSAVVQIRPVGADHVESDAVFEWRPYPDARFYIVEIEDGGGVSFYGQRLKSRHFCPSMVEGTSITAAGMNCRLKKAHRYRWKVSAYDEKGKVLSHSREERWLRWFDTFKVE